jgi:hypothetical protein
MNGRVLALALLGAACEEDVTHACDAGTPTCESSLVVLMPDPRTMFTVRIRDDVGFDATITCPSTDSDNFIDEEPEVQFFCGGGRVTLATYLHFEDHLFVTLEAGADQEFDPPPTQFGSDFCGNTCTLMTIQLQ